jgi:seryl-tRNA(Sec) selenium transferase
MGIIERRTLEKERENWKRAIKVEKEAIAAGNLALDEFTPGDPGLQMSRREHLLELQSRLAAVESRLASEELNVELDQSSILT